MARTDEAWRLVNRVARWQVEEVECWWVCFQIEMIRIVERAGGRECE